MLGENEYCGSNYVDTPYNAFCYFHCDYRPWGGNPPAQDSGYTPENKIEVPMPETEPEDIKEPEKAEESDRADEDQNEVAEDYYIPPDLDFGDDEEDNSNKFFWSDWFSGN